MKTFIPGASNSRRDFGHFLGISGVSFAFNPTAGLGSSHEPFFLNTNSEI